MIGFRFSPAAKRMFAALPGEVQRRIADKIDFFLTQDDPLAFAMPLKDAGPGVYRFRVGDYRVIFEWHADHVLITKVGHRRDVYRR